VYKPPYPVIIGFGFKAKRGKDTAVDSIIESRGGQYDIRRYAFADALREEVEGAAFDRWVQDYPNVPYNTALKTSPLAVAHNLCLSLGLPFDDAAVVEPSYPLTKQRALYQWFGTEHRRSKDPFYWVRKLRTRIESDNPKFALISDVRFRNELAYIRSVEGYTVKVDRPSHEDTLTSGQQSHASEVELDSAPADVWTHTLYNMGTLEDFKLRAVGLFDEIVASLSFPLIDELLAKAA
jgi:hypothetical protein